MSTDYINRPIVEENIQMLWKSFGHVPSQDDLFRLKMRVKESEREYQKQIEMAQYERTNAK